jgi:hypothetical protein
VESVVLVFQGVSFGVVSSVEGKSGDCQEQDAESEEVVLHLYIFPFRKIFFFKSFFSFFFIQ